MDCPPTEYMKPIVPELLDMLHKSRRAVAQAVGAAYVRFVIPKAPQNDRLAQGRLTAEGTMPKLTQCF